MPLYVGNRVVTRGEIVALGDAVPSGEHGSIIDVDPEDGGILVELDRHYPHLDAWQNCIFVLGSDAYIKLLSEPITLRRIIQRPFARVAIFIGVVVVTMSIGTVSRAVHHRAPDIAAQVDHITRMMKAQATPYSGPVPF